MSRISCSVMNCSHNDGGTCYANRISINGKKARTSNHTCCSSFLDKSTYSTLTNNTNDDGPCAIIGCNVKTCSYNASGTVCSLNDINVNSDVGNANLYSETHCSSFKCK
ncbi:DUF1540 domain-containing protein [Asaccharospora irregularis]|uniref:DUF1540 domain-containing protein n=1 Tax=Asaccharospora irregularis DSM 2635 TaxID=1121321 RepID=A0A1M5J912_9FIRM|nr:DUF1540 domain-containing protein [Asaccharospora irregularis]SHG37057.1 protein of unknown function [Asaccharospora irregularis DSM 2635]